MEEGVWNLLAQIGSCGVLWIPNTTNVLPLLGGDNHGGYGVVHKVRIERFDRIPNMIEFTKKTLKMNNKWKTRKQWLVEALACPCKHLGVIKFLAIHKDHMEAYTLWWNGGTLWEMLDYNTKYSPYHKLHESQFNNNSHAKFAFHKFVWNRNGCHSCTFIIGTSMLSFIYLYYWNIDVIIHLLVLLEHQCYVHCLNTNVIRLFLLFRHGCCMFIHVVYTWKSCTWLLCLNNAWNLCLNNTNLWNNKDLEWTHEAYKFLMPLLIILLYYDKGGHIWKGEHNLSHVKGVGWVHDFGWTRHVW
jgi:hypothetical protein